MVQLETRTLPITSAECDGSALVGRQRFSMALSKSRRFEVFKRDSFTCQYCGRRPPEVVLEVDHIHPVSQGGTDDELNLFTSCYDCNRGKRAKLLAEIAPRPDADLKWLEVQQETAELRRYQEALAIREAALNEVVERLQELWCTVSELDWCPKDRIVRQFLARYSPEVVEEAFRDVAPKVASGYIAGRYSGSGQAWVKYLWGVMRNADV